MKYAIIENDKVVNVVVSDTPLAPNWIASEVATIGDTYQSGEFIKPPGPSIEVLKQAKWEEIKTYRNKLMQEGGYKVGDKWFSSDTFSRSQQLGLVMLGANIPQGLMWKTMNGSFVEMTPTLAQEVFASAAAQDSTIFSHAESLNAQVQALTTAEEVKSFDITAGWPETYEP